MSDKPPKRSRRLESERGKCKFLKIKHERPGGGILKLKVFTFRFSESKYGFDDEIMQAFIADKEVIEFTEHFFVYDKTPYLTVILSYRDMDQDRRKITSREDP